MTLTDDEKAAVEARLRDLRAQRFQVSLRVEAPALGEPEGGSEADKAALAQLDKSIAALESKV